MFLGRHTCLPFVFEACHFEGVPLLARLGHAPPAVLLVGDRRRVARVLEQLDAPFDLSGWCARTLGAFAAARVAVGLGLSGDVPVLVVETQMGGAATEIITREVLDESFHPEPPFAVIRVGTCGVLGSLEPPPELAIASFACGWSGATWQSHHGVLQVAGGSAADLPRFACCAPVVAALEEGAHQVAPELSAARGGVLSKDSLYAEGGDDFGRVLEGLDCIATEMELATIAPLAKERATGWGGIMASAGWVPKGAWFGRERAERNESAAIGAALHAVRLLAKGRPS